MNFPGTGAPSARHTTPTRPWLSMTLLLVPTAVVAVDINVLFLTLPGLTTSLGASAIEQLWITDVYGLVVGVLAIVAGAVGDRAGRRRLLLLGCAGFLAASLLAAFSPSVWVLLTARVLQGVAGATLMPSTLALIGDLFADDRTRSRAVGIWATCQFACASFGPAVGGVLLHWFWWGSAFLLAVPACATVLVLGRRLLPESRPSDVVPRVDLLSAGLLIGALVSLFTAVKAFIPGSVIPLPVAGAAAGVAVVALVTFARRQRRLELPFLDLALLKVPTTLASVVSLAVVAVVLAGTGFWATQSLQSVVGLDPLPAALAFMPMGLGIGAGSFLAPALATRVPPEWQIPGGLCLAALGSLLLLTAPQEHIMLPMLVGITLTAFGCGPLFAFGTHRIVSGAPPSVAGRAAALAETANHLGSAVGLAVIGTVASGAFAIALRSTPVAIGSGSVTMADMARTAPNSPNPEATLNALAEAGTQALHTVGLLGAALLIACAALDVAVHRRRIAA